MKARFKWMNFFMLFLAVAIVAGGLSIDGYVRNAGAKYIVNEEDAPETDAILVLGALVKPDGTLSTMLNDRLTVGYELFQLNKAPKLLVSGDHGRTDYDEVKV